MASNLYQFNGIKPLLNIWWILAVSAAIQLGSHKYIYIWNTHWKNNGRKYYEYANQNKMNLER